MHNRLVGGVMVRWVPLLFSLSSYLAASYFIRLGFCKQWGTTNDGGIKRFADI
jgi:hypothetical protein